MTFSDFNDLNNNIIIGSNCCGQSGWIFSLAPVVKPDLDYACIQLAKFREFFKYPLSRHFNSFLIRLRLSIFIAMLLLLRCFVIIMKSMKTYNQK